MSVLYTIKPQDTIGNSLSSININYSNLELDTFIIQASADKYWTPMLEYYLNFNKFLKETTSICQRNSAILINTATLVENNSAGWIKPITIFYPSLFPSSYPADSIVESISAWLESYFPVINPTTFVIDETTGNTITIPPKKTNYVENQMAIVYAHTWKYGTSISENQFILDHTLCTTANKTICTQCTDRYYGYVYCSNGDFNCTGQSFSCQKCGTLNCFYKTPPYNLFVPPITFTWKTEDRYSTVPTIVSDPVLNKKGIILKYIKKVIQRVVKTTTRTLVPSGRTPNRQNAYGSIAANVEMTFQDRNESDTITAVVFKIKNCKWVFDNKYIT
jgi:hypothetical protein